MCTASTRQFNSFELKRALEQKKKGRQLRGPNLRPRLRVSKLQWAFITQNGY